MTNTVYWIDGFKAKDKSYKSKDILINIGDIYIRFETITELDNFAKQCQQTVLDIEKEREDAKNNQ